MYTVFLTKFWVFSNKIRVFHQFYFVGYSMVAIAVDVHHDGAFVTNPLGYNFGSVIRMIFSEMSFDELFEYLEKEIGNSITGVYYLLPECPLEEGKGLMSITCDNDVDTLFEIASSYGKLQVYLDHFDEDLSMFVQQKSEGIVDDKENDDNVDDRENDGENDGNVDDRENDDKDETASIDHLSEGEDELLNLRQGKTKPIHVPDGIEEPERYVDEKEQPETIVDEHEKFMKKIHAALNMDELDIDSMNAKKHGQDDEFPIHDESTHWRPKKPKV